MTHLNGLDGAIGLKVTPVDKVIIVNLMFVGAGEPRGTAGDMRIHEVSQHFAGLFGGFGLPAITGLRAERHRADIALDKFRMLLQILFGGLFDFGGGELSLETLHIDRTIAGHAYDHELAPRFVMVVVLRMHDGDYHVLQNVGGLPRTTIGTRMVGIGEFDHLVDGGGIRGRTLLGGRGVGAIDGFRLRSGQRLDVPSLAGRRLRESVLADLHRSQEFL